MVWALPVLIGMWGAAYLRSCVRALEVSNTPVAYPLSTPGGVLDLRAEAWRLEWRANRIAFARVTVHEPGGALLARIDRLALADLIPGAKGPLTATVDGAWMMLERLSDGTLKLQRYMPEPDPDAKSVPFEIGVSGATVQFVDHSGPATWRRRVFAKSLLAQTDGKAFSGRLDAEIESAGPVRGAVRLKEGELFVDASSDGLAVADLLQRFSSTPDRRYLPELARVKVETAFVVGRVRLRGSDKRPLQAEGYGQVAARRLTVDGEAYGDVEFGGLVQGDAAAGDLRVASGTFVADGKGAVRWGERATVGGEVVASAAALRDMPDALRRLVPPTLRSDRPRYEGWVGYADDALELSGFVQARSVTYQAEAVARPSARVAMAGDALLARVEEAEWQGSNLTGLVAVQPSTGKLAGKLEGAEVRLERWARRLGLDLVGEAGVEAILEGTTSDPLVALVGDAQATLTWSNRRLPLGRVSFAAQADAKSLVVNRFRSDGQLGLLVGDGRVDLKSGALNLELLGHNVPLELLDPSLEGRSSATVKVGGTTANPVATGRAEAFDVRVASKDSNLDLAIPVAVAEFSVDRKRFVASDLLAIRGASRLEGSGAYTFQTGAINAHGAVEGLQLSDLLGDDYAGSINAPRLYATGTLDDPRIEASLDGHSLVAHALTVDGVRAEAVFEDRTLRVVEGALRLGKGTLAATGTYQVDRKQAAFDLVGDALDLDRVMVNSSLDVAITGTWGARAKGTWSEDAGLTFDGSVDIEGLRLNGTDLGRGSWTVAANRDVWTASGSVGLLEGFIEVPEARYDAASEQIQGEFLTQNIKLQDLLRIGERYWTPKDEELQPDSWLARLGSLQGLSNSRVVVSGSVRDPNVDEANVELNDLRFEGRESGDLSLKGRRAGDQWSVDSLQWTGGPGDLMGSGIYSQSGALDFDAELQNINASWLALLYPSFANLKGQADMSIRATGTVEEPLVQASLGYREGAAADQDRRQLELLATAQKGSLSAEGSYYFEGFTGPIVATLPFEFPFTIPSDRPISAKVTLPDRDVRELKDLLPWLDVERSSGTVSGELNLSGTTERLALAGGLRAKGERLASEGVATHLQDYSVEALLRDDVVEFVGSAAGSGGGRVSLDGGRYAIGNVADSIGQTNDVLLTRDLAGRVVLDHLKVDQGSYGGTLFSGEVSGAVVLTGTAKQPVLTGDLAARGGSFTLGEMPESSAGPAFPIDPRFSVNLLLEDHLALQAGTGRFRLSGGGRLEGSLSQPLVAMDFEVEQGSLRLPNARVFIEPGGTIGVLYRTSPYGAAMAQANVNLTGRTQISAPGLGNTIELYSVTLGIRGDLMRDNGLSIVASSDPPTLSQDRILTLLGQGELLAGRPGESRSVGLGQQLQAALSIALPYVLGGFTERIGQSLGLDYLGVEYAGSSLVTVTAAKSLGKNLALSGRRQISNPLPGQPVQYDIRLSYRLPVRNRLLSRLSFSVGTDQDRPWKLSVEYGIRF